MEISAKVEARIRAALAVLEPQQACLLAYSGGLDSSVLLHAIHRMRPDVVLRAAHIDHALQPASQQWGRHCAQQCSALSVPFVTVRLTAEPPTGNLEAWARDQRYAQLEGLLAEDETLLTAHHLRDQAETLLMNLLRGSGVSGLAAMPAQRRLGGHTLLRPLLAIHPDDLRSYAQQHQLEFIDDPSNDDERFDRNFLRHEVLARLEQRFPQALSNMARSAQLLAESLDAEPVNPQGNSARLPIQPFVDGELAQNNRRLLHWLKRLNLPLPRYRMLDEIWQQVLSASADSQPLIRWPGAELRRYRQHLYAMAPLQASNPLIWRALPAQGEREWPWGGRVHWDLPPGDWRICNPQGGERIVLNGQHRRLKTLFQQAAIPPWQRQRTPLLCCGDECLAVGDRWQVDSGVKFTFHWASPWGDVSAT